MILSASRHHSSDEMNDIRPASGYFLRLAPAKAHSPKPVKLHCCVWPPPFFAPVFGRSKNGGQMAWMGFRLNWNTFHWGSLISLGCQLLLASVFPLSLDAHQIKQSLPPSFLTGKLVKLQGQNKFETFSDFLHVFTCQLARCQNAIEARKTFKLSADLVLHRVIVLLKSFL